MSKKNFAVGAAGQGESSASKNLMSPSRRKKMDKEKTVVSKKFEEQKVVLSIKDHIKRVSENWDALEDRIVIFSDTPAVMTKGGLFLPEQSVAKPSRGTIVLIGPGEFNKLDRMKGISLGDRAIYGRFAGTDVELDGELYTIVRVTDIMLREKKKATV